MFTWLHLGNVCKVTPQRTIGNILLMNVIVLEDKPVHFGKVTLSLQKMQIVHYGFNYWRMQSINYFLMTAPLF